MQRHGTESQDSGRTALSVTLISSQGKGLQESVVRHRDGARHESPCFFFWPGIRLGRSRVTACVWRWAICQAPGEQTILGGRGSRRRRNVWFCVPCAFLCRRCHARFGRSASRLAGPQRVGAQPLVCGGAYHQRTTGDYAAFSSASGGGSHRRGPVCSPFARFVARALVTAIGLSHARPRLGAGCGLRIAGSTSDPSGDVRPGATARTPV